MNRESLIRQATTIYESWQAQAPKYAKMGVALPSVGRASLDELIGHYTFCAEQGEANNVTVDAGRFWGKTREEITAAAQALGKASRKRNGVRALKAKYGHDAAERIVSKHAGRHISIQ